MLIINNPKIIWEKWTDPYGIDHNDIVDYDQYINEDQEINTYKIKHNHVLLTSMGMIPYNESTDCCKIFNFWIGHTNFNLSSRIAQIIQDVDGVETLDIFTRYRFRVSFGKAFIDRDIMNSINTTISSVFDITHND